MTLVVYSSILNRPGALRCFIISFIVTLVFLIFSLLNTLNVTAKVSHSSEALELALEASDPPCVYSDSLLRSDILKPLPRSWGGWPSLLHALEGSVDVINLPKALSRDLKDACNNLPTALTYKATAIHTHQHSLEARFPRGLRDMSRDGVDSASAGFGFRPLHTARDKRAALFHYVAALPYHAVYCTPKNNNKVSKDFEQWAALPSYWSRVGRFLDKASSNSAGHLLLPASHPRSVPTTARVGVLQRASFLSTDLDYAGDGGGGDIVVPYFQPIPQLPQTWSRGAATLLFFAGADAPHKGLRWRLGEAIKRYTRITGEAGVSLIDYHLFSSSTDNMNNQEYQQRMQSAAFCLVVRGDTHSSRRLFGAIANGCVPVIISDGILLPFERFLDFSAFSLNFSEEFVVTHAGVTTLIGYLQKLVEDGRYASMRSLLPAAAKALLFDDLQDPQRTRSVVNPVTLALADAFFSLAERCEQSPHTDQCVLVRERESMAKLLDF